MHNFDIKMRVLLPSPNPWPSQYKILMIHPPPECHRETCPTPFPLPSTSPSLPAPMLHTHTQALSLTSIWQHFILQHPPLLSPSPPLPSPILYTPLQAFQIILQQHIILQYFQSKSRYVIIQVKVNVAIESCYHIGWRRGNHNGYN